MKRLLLILLFSLTYFLGFSQIININNSADAESSYSLQTLIEDVLISGTCAQINTFTEQVSGLPTDNQNKSYGFFKRPTGSNFPFEAGVVLSTGKAYSGGNVTNGDLVSNDVGLSGDLDLQSALSITDTNDATYVKFNFIPATNTISFKFIMASEEYDGVMECDFADSFAFLLREVGTTNYINMAVLPDGTPVSVTNINNANYCAANQQYFEGYNLTDTNYGGRTKILTATASVTPNQVYEMKMVVADQGDSIYDSAIFLEAGSFGGLNLGADLGTPNLTADNTAVCGDSKLLDANIAAISYKWFKDGVEIPGETNQTYNANLGNGLYKIEANIAAGCSADDEVQLQFVTAATINNNITNLYACDSDFDGIATFNLTDKDTEILIGQDPTEFEVLYYSDNAYTTLVPDATSLDSSGQTIYVTVQNRASTNCFAQSSFTIEIATTEAAEPQNIPNLAACDDTTVGNSFDGHNLFDLEDRKTVILNGSSDSDYTLTYFTDNAYTNQIPSADINSYTNTSVLQTIYVQMTNNLDSDCWDRTSFEIEVYELPKITSPVLFRQCDDDTDHIALMDLTLANSYISDNFANENFTYFVNQIDAENGNMALSIPNPTSYVSGNNTIWVRVENQHCFIVGQVDIDITVSNTAYNTTLTECDDFIDDVNNDYDNISEFDLTTVTSDVLALFPTAVRPNLNITFYPSISDAQLQTNLIQHPNKYRNTTTTTLTTPERIYIRVENQNNLDCPGMGLDLYIDLIVESIPYFEVSDQLLCSNLLPTPQQMEAFNYLADYSYEWKDALGNILQTDATFDEIAYFTSSGEHSVTATSTNGCTKTKTFNVALSSIPIIKTLTIFDDLENNKISLIVTGQGDYEFALDDEAFSDGNELDGHVFYDVVEGAHTIHINDKNGCTPTLDVDVVVVRFPKYISPNHDGKHDEFYVYGGNGFAISQVTIFDRYGKVITILNQNEKWDGTHLGKLAIEADYWFVATFIDFKGKTYERKGHFSLKI